MRNFKTNRILLLGSSAMNMLPTANFSYVVDGLEVTFTDLSSDPDGTITDWDWDFGDTNTSTLQNPVHTYASTGTYTISLTVTDNDLNTAEYEITLKINAIPVANFTFVDNNGREIDFTDASTDSDGTIVGWSWDFGDGIGTSSLQNPTYTYASPGSYDVILTVTDSDGATDDVTITVTPNENPVANFTYVEDGLEVTFTDASTDSDGTVDEWAWDFGDTNTSALQNPVHTYSTAGTYTVGLTVTDNDGATHYYEEEIIVEEPPAPAFASIRSMFVADTYTTNAQEITIFTDDIQEDDLLIVIHATDGAETVVPPVYVSDSSDAGYGTEITEQVAGDDTLTIWAKQATVGDIGEDIEITWGSIERSVAAMLILKNHNGVDSAASTNFSGGTATTSPTSPSVTTSVDNCLIIRGLIVDDNNTGTFPFPTVPSGELVMHTRNFGGGAGGVMLSLVVEEQATAGATGTAGWTITAARGSVGFTIAIEPGVLGGTSPDISTGLVEMWDLEDTSAAIDNVNHALSIVNGATFVTGKIGDAVQAEPTTKYVQTTYANSTALFPGTDDFTLAFWIRPDNVVDTSYESGIRGGISIGNNASGSTRFSVDYRPNLNSVLPRIHDGTAEINQYIDINLQDNTWQFWIIRVHRKGFMSVQSNKTWYGQRVISSYSAVNLVPTVGGFRIGYGSENSTGGAQIDSVMLYHKVLEYDNSLVIYNDGNGISSLDLP